jgi:crossover junction endodeoxyribonuclease RuvC
MIAMGLDPGLTLGWALYSPAAGVRSCGVLDLRQHGDDLGARLGVFESWLSEMARVHRVDLIAIERPFGPAHTVVTPSVICAVAHMAAHNMRLPRMEFAAVQIKKAIAGSGTAKKPDVQRALERAHGFDFSHIKKADQNDAADAAGCAVLAWARAHQ